MLALGWTLFSTLYAIGLAYFIATDVAAWRKQGIAFSWRMIDRRKFAWPIAMISDTMKIVRR